MNEKKKQAYTTSICNKGDRRVRKNYRGISTIATVERICEKILRNKTKGKYQGNIGEDHPELTSDRSTVELI